MKLRMVAVFCARTFGRKGTGRRRRREVISGRRAGSCGALLEGEKGARSRGVNGLAQALRSLTLPAWKYNGLRVSCATCCSVLYAKRVNGGTAVRTGERLDGRSRLGHWKLRFRAPG